MYGYVYKTTNKVNNKIYIGQKKSPVFLGNKYFGSGKYLKHAINKYGEQNFCVELVECAESKEELSNLEIFYIKKYNSTNSDIGYNIAKGGIGGGEVYVHNEIENAFIPKLSLDYYLQNGYKLGMMPGRKELNHSTTRGKNISKALLGRTKSEEHIKNHSDALKKSHRHWYTNGIVGQDLCLKESDDIPDGYYRGRTISDETKKKCGLKNIGRTSWNKGLTKETDERVKKYGEKQSKNKHIKQLNEKGG